MPHVIVKLWPGKSEQQKARLAGKIARDVMDVLNYGEESVSVALEEIKSPDLERETSTITKPTDAVLRLAATGNLAQRVPNLGESRVEPRKQLLSCHGRRHAARCSSEKPNAESLLETAPEVEGATNPPSQPLSTRSPRSTGQEQAVRTHS